MTRLELFVFNVGHGLSVAIVERPANYLTLIDLGRDSGFTPLKYLNLKEKLRPDLLYITHPHADHLDDVSTALDNNFQPLGLSCQSYDWSDVKKKERPELGYKIDQYQRLIQAVPYKLYSGEARCEVFYYTPDKAKQRWGEASYVNNSSLFIVYTWRDFKITIAGDLETDAIDAMIASENVKAAAKGTGIFVPSHHGHMNGFPSQWVTNMGKTFVSIISVQERDPHVDCRYSSPDFAKGISFAGQTRYSLTTRSDGNIKVSMWYESDTQAKWAFTSF